MAEARRLLQELGAVIAFPKTGVFSPAWLGAELCSLATTGAPSASSDPAMHEVLKRAALERNLCVAVAGGGSGGGVSAFARLPTACPDAAAQIIAETVPQQRTLFRVPKAVAAGLQCRIVCKISQIKASAMRLR